MTGQLSILLNDLYIYSIYVCCDMIPDIHLDKQACTLNVRLEENISALCTDHNGKRFSSEIRLLVLLQVTILQCSFASRYSLRVVC